VKCLAGNSSSWNVSWEKRLAIQNRTLQGCLHMPATALIVAWRVGVNLYSYLECFHITQELYRGKASESRSRVNSASRADLGVKD